MDGWDGKMTWREILKKKEWQTSRIRKERNDTKRRSYRGLGVVWGEREKGSHMGRDNYIRVPRNCEISTTDIGILSMR